MRIRPRLASLPNRLQQIPQRASVSSDSWRSGKTKTSERGYGWRWQQYRIAFLGTHPLCVKCAARNLITAATVVDHITPHRGDERLFWDENNHQALCAPCHDSDKAREERERGQR